MLQLFAEGEAAPPALSEAQTRQAVASGTMKPDEAKYPLRRRLRQRNRRAAAGKAPAGTACAAPRTATAVQLCPQHTGCCAQPACPLGGRGSGHAPQPAGFDLQNELRSPEMRRLMQLPGMRVRDAYRLAHYDENLRTAAQAVEQGVVERIQQRAARPTENGIRPGGAATVRPDVASMTRAQREALERRVLHGAQIEL